MGPGDAGRGNKPYAAGTAPWAVVNGWLITLGLINAYVLLLVWLHRSGRMEKWNLGLLLGFILMIRTQRGRDTLKWLSRPRWLWNGFGDVGVAVAFVGMALMTVLMVALVPRLLSADSGVTPLGASEILVIPGVNPFVPLWYGIIALIVTLVVHEGGHGVVALANGMRLKTLGLLYAVIPIGAFVEPDEDDLMESPRRNRLRVYAAGAMVNLVVAAITLAAFAGMAAALDPHEGAGIQAVVGDPALDAGIGPGDILVAADGVALTDWESLTAILDNTTPGQNLTFTLHTGGNGTATLVSRWSQLDGREQQDILDEKPEALEWCRQQLEMEETPRGGECADGLEEDAFLGVSPFPADRLQYVLSHPVSGLAEFGFAMAMPLGEVRDAPYLSVYLPAFYETPFDADLFWPIANVVFWVFWINLMVGLTNILPMLPLDGGHLFRDGVGGVMARLKPKMERERRDRIVGRLAGAMSLVILGSFLLQVFGPRLV